MDGTVLPWARNIFKPTELGPHDENRNFVMYFEMGKNKMSKELQLYYESPGLESKK